MATSSSSQLVGDLPPIPIELGGPDDASTFVGLDLALRSTSDLLRREGSHNLSPKALSNITAGMRWFQDFHLGKDAKGLRWPIVRIPDKIFLDRNRGGPLFTALLSAFRHKSTQSWRSFDFKNPKRYDDNIALFKKMERDLKAAGYITRPVIFFDDNIPETNRANVERIATKFGASIVQDPMKASHIVAHDPEEMDTDEDIRKEEERDNSGDSPDRTYLRTMAVVNVDKNNANTPKPSSSSSNKKRFHAMALVHWWFWPTSADEWIPASDVDGVPDNEKNSPNGPDEKTWVVSCKFVRDVALFNEWGLEMDYIIMDYTKKVTLFTDPTKSKMMASMTSVTVKKSGNTNQDVKIHKGNDSENSALNREDRNSTFSAAVASSHVDDLSIAKTKKSSSTNSIHEIDDVHDLDHRRGGNGMNPRVIPTGEVVAKGEKLKTIVFDGALRIAPVAREMMENYANQNSLSPKTPSHLYEDLIDIKGPSMDETLPSILVVELSESKTHINKTVAISRQVWKEVRLQRIRGGGEEAEENKCTSNSPYKTKGDTAANVLPIGSDNSVSLVPKTESGNATKNDMHTIDEFSPTPTSMTKINAPSDDSLEQKLNKKNTQLPKEDNISSSTNKHKVEQGISSFNTSIVSDGKNVANVPFKTDTSYDVSTTPAKLNSTMLVGSTKGTRSTIQTNNPNGALLNSLIISSGKTALVQISAGGDNQASQTEIPPISSTVTAPLTTESKISTSSIQTQLPTIGNNLSKRLPIAASEVKSQTLKGSSLTARLLSSVPKFGPSPNASLPMQTSLPSLPPNVNKNVTAVTSAIPTNRLSVAAEVVQSKSSPLPPNAVPPKGLLSIAPLQTNKPLITDNSIHPLPMATLAVTKQMPLQPNTIPPSQMTSTQPSSSSSSIAIEETVYTPKWYNKTIPSQFEKQMLPEWFNGSAPHRTSSNYVFIRNGIMNMVKTNSNRFITATAVRKSFAGDAGSLLRLHSFLMAWGMINNNTIGDSMPSSMMSTPHWGKSHFSEENNNNYYSLNKNNSHNFHRGNNHDWTDADRKTLTQSVVEHVQKKRRLQTSNAAIMKTDPSSELWDTSDEDDLIIIDWDFISKKLGNGHTPNDCKIQFMSSHLDENNDCEMNEDNDNNDQEKEIQSKSDINSDVRNEISTIPTMESSNETIFSKEEIIRDIVSKARPDLVEQALNVAISVDNSNLIESKNVAILAGVASEAMEKAKKEEEKVNELQLEILNQRMLKLENRMSLLNETEELLDLERTMLELERRDLYTARCRYWLGGGTGLG